LFAVRKKEDMMIDTLEAIELGGTTQWIRTRGSGESNPILLMIQQGPGLPMLNEARHFERTLGLEKDFTVVYWDQRGCGRSLRDRRGQSEISLDRMAADAVSLLEILRDRSGGDSYVVGFSFGGTVAATAAAQRPDLVRALVAVGMDIDGEAAATCAYDFALATANARGNKRAARRLKAIGPPPHLTAKQFSTRVRWASTFGGVTTHETYGSMARGLVASLLRSPDYSLGDVVRTLRGVSATQEALLSELAVMDLVHSLPVIDVPVVMAQGRLDQVAPGEAAQRYFDQLNAPSKQLAWFEHSAHTPQLEEPQLFRSLLLQIRAGEFAST
jgi:pimeloyl-ACP methyl ester carboxylesterase